MEDSRGHRDSIGECGRRHHAEGAAAVGEWRALRAGAVRRLRISFAPAPQFASVPDGFHSVLGRVPPLFAGTENTVGNCPLRGLHRREHGRISDRVYAEGRNPCVGSIVPALAKRKSGDSHRHHGANKNPSSKGGPPGHALDSPTLKSNNPCDLSSALARQPKSDGKTSGPSAESWGKLQMR
jgi:hypothetical protein